MNGEQIQAVARTRAEELPGSSLTHPFGPDWDVFKVRGKVLLLQTATTGEQIVILKATPADSTTLRDAYPDITPGYHMNKRHWITLNPGGAIDEELVRNLVTESYLLVVENLPRSKRPVDPQTFGQSAK